MTDDADFRRDFESSQDHHFAASMNAACRKMMGPMVPVVTSTVKQNKQGIDCFFGDPNQGGHLKIEAKMYRGEWRGVGKTPVFLEIWSCIERKQPGWTLDPSKVTDFVIFVWKGNRRFIVVDYKNLRRWFRTNLAALLEDVRCPTKTQPQKGHHERYNAEAMMVNSAELIIHVDGEY